MTNEVKSVLETKASYNLQLEVEEELKKKDPDQEQSKAVLDGKTK